MEVGKRVRITSDLFPFAGMEGIITAISQGTYRITVRLDKDGDEWPFDEDELEVIDGNN